MKFNLLKGGKKKKAAKTADVEESFDPEVTQTGVEKTVASKSLFAKFFSKKPKKSVRADEDYSENNFETSEDGETSSAPKNKSLFAKFFSKKPKKSTASKNTQTEWSADEGTSSKAGKNKSSKTSYRAKSPQGLHPVVQLLLLILPWLGYMAYTPDLSKREKDLMVVLDRETTKVEKTLSGLLEKEKQIQAYKDQQKLGQSKVGFLRSIKNEKELVAKALDRLPALANDNLWFSGSEFQKTVEGNWFYVEGFADQDSKVADLMFLVKDIELFDAVELVFTKRVPLGNADVVNFKIKARFKEVHQVAMNERSAPEAAEVVEDEEDVSTGSKESKSQTPSSEEEGE